MVALTGGSSNHAGRIRRLAGELPSLLQRRMLPTPGRKRQLQRRLTPEQAEHLAAEYRAGESVLQLARSRKLHRTTVAEHVRRAGIPTRHRGIPPEMVAEAIRLYQSGWSCQRLAERYRCNAETVRQMLKRNSVSMRRPWERS